MTATGPGAAAGSRSPDRAARLLAAAARIRASAVGLPDDALTAPDPESGERWDRGQALAHVAEMLPYWAEQAERIATGRQTEFGRTRSDPERVGAIDRDRREHPQRLLDRVDEGVATVLALLDRLDAQALARTGHHQTLGTMTVAEIVDRFAVAHLEEHADQLELRPAT
ncbi:MAG TPA: DinB family protein [Actinomycetota bacterium]|nr:DinB family protein [Actinomycetota bacterium]